MKEVRAWLPQTALRDGKILKVLKSVVSEWALDWLNLSSIILLEVGRKDTNPELDGHFGQAFITDPEGLVQIGGLMIGLDSEALRDIAQADAKFLRDIGLKAVTNFNDRLRQLTKSPDETFADQAGIANFRQYSMLYNNKELGLISLSSSQAIHIRKSLIPNTERTSSDLCSIDSLIHDATVKVGAFLGAVDVGLAELHNLECGQVVVMQQKVDALLPLLINAKVSTQIGCTFVVTGDGASLTISS
ncbi:hypothetical protein [Candidatus Phycosocius spiralis]|uniref:Uncharacterized protein n=1 Tax=Candidatus Phycosocius spiralis TaxID=2815099 RepID=A0ABQ4PZE9_9PROT|nr:hypothetical protein [Candidatus Phycosocius spiralis]GIU68049.1 hypothetical protein PsB1_2203 [Candidatus Phycosocius spiralis]